MPHLIEVVLALLAVAVGLGIVARRIGIPYPILLVLGVLVLSLQDWAPEVRVDPQVILLLFLPPLLYAGGFRTEWAEFREQLRSITLLAVGLVLFSTVLVAVVAHCWIGLSWATGFVLGALVSPPDAVAAIAVLQRIRIPRVIVTLLEGESLVNDASALVVLRLAIAAVATGVFSPGDAVIEFAKVSAGGIGIGLAGGWLVIRFHRLLSRKELADAKLTITITLLTPFAVYLPAEHLHVSGVLAAVTAGLWMGSHCEEVFPQELYEEARAVWEWLDFLLNSLIFILIGLMLPQVLDGLGADRGPGELALYAVGVTAVVIVARLVWMFPGAYAPRWLDSKLFGISPRYPSWRGVVVVGWTGMRGGVSLAAALALPPFPERGLIQFLTFWVIFATLVGQGLTLPLVIRWLGVSEAPDATPGPEDAPGSALREYQNTGEG